MSLYLFSTGHKHEYKVEDMEKKKGKRKEKREATNISRKETDNDEKVALT